MGSLRKNRPRLVLVRITRVRLLFHRRSDWMPESLSSYSTVAINTFGLSSKGSGFSARVCVFLDVLLEMRKNVSMTEKKSDV
jgi:hypothetical protein